MMVDMGCQAIFSVLFLVASSMARAPYLSMDLPEFLKAPFSAGPTFEMLEEQPNIDSSSPCGTKQVGFLVVFASSYVGDLSECDY